VGVSVERLTHDRYKWRGEDIQHIQAIASRHVPTQALPSASTPAMATPLLCKACCGTTSAAVMLYHALCVCVCAACMS
jgi:hypothetical protein